MNKSQVDAEHNQILQEVIAEEPSRKPQNSPIVYLIGIILAILLIMWLVPDGVIPPRAKIKNIPSLETVLPESTIPSRVESNDINIFVINEDPTLKLIASKVVTSACSQPDKKCYAQALFYFVQNNIVYVTDPVGEYYELPMETLMAGAADCDGHAILLASLLRNVGVLTEFVFTPNHVAVQAWVPKHSLLPQNKYAHEWYHLDPTCKSCKPGQHMP